MCVHVTVCKSRSLYLFIDLCYSNNLASSFSSFFNLLMIFFRDNGLRSCLSRTYAGISRSALERRFVAALDIKDFGVA